MAVPPQLVINCCAEIFVLVNHLHRIVVDDRVSLGWRVSSKVNAHIFSFCFIQAQIHLCKKELCPAWQKKCSKCHRQNHFAVCCPPDIRKRVNNVDHEEHSESSESDSEFLVNVVKQDSTMKQDKKSHSGPIYVEMIIVDTKQPVKLQVDCGAEINVILKRYIPNVLYYSDLEHFCGFYAIQNKLSSIIIKCDAGRIQYDTANVEQYDNERQLGRPD